MLNEERALHAIRLSSIRVLINLPDSTTRTIDRELARRRFLESAQEFDATVNFLVAIRVLLSHADTIFGGVEFSATTTALRGGDQALAAHIAVLAVRSSSAYGADLRNTLMSFRLDDGVAAARFEYLRGAPYSARDFLLESGAIQRDNSTKSFHITDWFYSEFITARFGWGMSPETLDRKIDGQAEIGCRAELEVLAYERSLVCERDLSTVVHIAKLNVGAGFDIASTRRDKTTGLLHFRMIEVKAVSEVDWAFTFTKNEMRAASESKDIYFLYLVPVINGRPAVAKMEVIQDPVSLLLGSPQWEVQEGDWQVRQGKGDG